VTEVALHPLLAAVVVGVLLLVGVYVVALLDAGMSELVAGRRRRATRLLADPLQRAAQLVLSAPGGTERPDTQGWILAPALLTGLAGVAFATVPLTPNLSIADPSTGFVLFSAAIAFVMIAVFLHGWSPNSVWPLHGAYRFGAAALSLQIPFLLAMLATTLPAESLQIGEIVRAQEGSWNLVRQPLGLPIYLVVGVGVSFWGPLDFPDADDLAGGTAAESGGVDALLWQVARAAMLVAVAAMGAAAFLGGWWGPWRSGAGWMLLKTALLLGVLVATRHLVARVRLERFVIVCWTVLIPLALLNIFVAGAWLL
jgi:NADH-quinone oxidoreductase subunit H